MYGAIFVIDASDYSRVDEAKQALSEALSDYRMKGKPLLIFANKQDIEGAMQASDIVMKLGLMSFDSANDKDNDHNDNDTATDNKDTSASTSKSITTAPDQFSVIACSAKAKAGASLSNVDRCVRFYFVFMRLCALQFISVCVRELDTQRSNSKRRTPLTCICIVFVFTSLITLYSYMVIIMLSSIRNGVSWLQSAIESDLANLTARVTRQAAEQRAEEDRKREERRLRVEQAREERRRQEEEDEGKEKETRKKTKEERSSSSGSSGGNIDTQPCTSTSEKDTSNDSVDIVDVSIKDGYSENGNNNKSMNEEQQAENYDSLNKLDDTVNNDDVMDSVKKLQVPPPISPCIIRDNDNEEVNNDTNGGMISSGSENAYAKVSVPGSYPSPQPSPSK